VTVTFSPICQQCGKNWLNRHKSSVDFFCNNVQSWKKCWVWKWHYKTDCKIVSKNDWRVFCIPSPDATSHSSKKRSKDTILYHLTPFLLSLWPKNGYPHPFTNFQKIPTLLRLHKKLTPLAPPTSGVVDGWASRDVACQAGGLGLIPGPGQTYV
jgi:hypothetical protein